MDVDGERERGGVVAEPRLNLDRVILRKRGMSKGRAAAISNSPGSSSRGGKRSGSGGGTSQSSRSRGSGSGGNRVQKQAAGRKGGRKSS